MTAIVRLLNVYTISTFVALAGTLFGFDIASVSGVVGTDQYKKFYGNPLGTRQGGITGAMAAGSFVGALSSSYLGDNAGLCIGLTSSLVPIYQSEIAPRKIRGRIVVFQVFAITWGILIQYFIQYGCSFLDSEAAFRIPWAIQVIPAVILFIGLFWLPRSPRWLASVNRWDEALRVLVFLRSAKGDINDPLVLAEYKEIEEQIRCEREENANSFRELQLSGMNVLIYYTVYVLQSAGIANARLASSYQYNINIVMTIPCLAWTDRWGRRPSLLVEPNPVLNEPYTWISIGHTAASRSILACSYLAVGTFAVAWAPISWLYPTEVAPLRVRAKSVSLATAANWATNFALGFAVPPLLRAIKWRLFFLFGSFNIAAFIHVLLAMPETKQRTLEEMDEIFEHGDPLWKSFRDERDTDRLERLAREIEMGILKAHRSSHVQRPDGIAETGSM
ncbi:hypothetical protein V1522DRAFT_438086 [Lipomyces starkeyi]